MSRSFKHFPYYSRKAQDTSEKRIENQRLRSRARTAIASGNWEAAEIDIPDPLYHWMKDGCGPAFREPWRTVARRK